MNHVIKFLQKNIIWEVLILMIFSIFLGKYYHSLFISLKTILPLALFLMLYKPMVYLDIGKAFTKITDIKKKISPHSDSILCLNLPFIGIPVDEIPFF